MRVSTRAGTGQRSAAISAPFHENMQEPNAIGNTTPTTTRWLFYPPADTPACISPSRCPWPGGTGRGGGSDGGAHSPGESCRASTDPFGVQVPLGLHLPLPGGADTHKPPSTRRWVGSKGEGSSCLRLLPFPSATQVHGHQCSATAGTPTRYPCPPVRPGRGCWAPTWQRQPLAAPAWVWADPNAPKAPGAVTHGGGSAADGIAQGRKASPEAAGVGQRQPACPAQAQEGSRKGSERPRVPASPRAASQDPQAGSWVTAAVFSLQSPRLRT